LLSTFATKFTLFFTQGVELQGNQSANFVNQGSTLLQTQNFPIPN
jgi:hypothetical protein